MTATDIDTRHLVTVSLVEAGQLLGISRAQSFRMAKRGDFPVPVRVIANKQRVRLLDIERLLDE